MNARTMIVTAASTLALLLAAGCTGEKDKKIEILSRDKTLLTQQKTQLVADIQAAKDQLAKADADMTAKEQALADLRQKNAALEAKIGTLPPPPPGQPTWVVAGDVLFSAGQAVLNTQRSADLDRVVAALKGKNQPIRIVGHTDSDPIVRTAKLWRDNYDLSNARALAVKQYLVSRGLAAVTIETVGMGPDKPVASNATRTGKAQNRRVEIYILAQQTADLPR